MVDSNIYRRLPFPNRPWITGLLWDKYSSVSILHLDAYVFDVSGIEYLLIDWREGGRKQVALDCYLIESDGLTPVWDAGRVWSVGKPVYWHAGNRTRMARIHKTVLAQRERMLALGAGRWARVVTQAHYVMVRETDCEIAGEANKYKPPVNAPDPLTRFKVPKRRGRPRKVRTTLPDWL